MTKRASHSDLDDMVVALRKAGMAMTLADWSGPQIIGDRELWSDAMRAISKVEHLLFDDEEEEDDS